jgi:DNA topoisomerase 2-associated protein PAT1
MSGFFGFDPTLPERRAGLPSGQQQFAANNRDETFGLARAGEEEDLAVYTWGEGYDNNLLEGGDDMNDETFGEIGSVGE